MGGKSTRDRGTGSSVWGEKGKDGEKEKKLRGRGGENKSRGIGRAVNWGFVGWALSARRRSVWGRKPRANKGGKKKGRERKGGET